MDCNTIQLRLATLPALDEILRDGARRALQSAIEREVGEYIESNSRQVDQEGRRLVVRNGYHPARRIQTGSGSIEVRDSTIAGAQVASSERGSAVRYVLITVLLAGCMPVSSQYGSDLSHKFH